MPAPHVLTVKELGLTAYESAWQAMQTFTDTRDANTPDELWFLEHPPVFTLGRNGKQEYLHDTGTIPVLKVDRGGQVTYHGPGQLIAYTLLNIKRRRLGVQLLVRMLEQSVIDLLSDYSLSAQRREQAPGVYIDNRKIAALGLRIRKGCSFHGLSLNVDMDLSPFAMIDPCGYSGLEVTQLRDLGIAAPLATISAQFRTHFERLLDKQAP
jgi:lipoyl(octanoyl) transferase